jgi:hypothetical protein
MANTEYHSLDPDSRLAKLLIEAHETKMETERLGERYAQLVEQASTIAATLPQHLEIVHDTALLRTTYITAETLQIDTDGLKNDLNEDQWDRCSKRVLDKELLEACVAAKVIGKEVVDAHSTLVPKRPYFLFKSSKRSMTKKQPVKRASAKAKSIRR